MAFKCSKCGLCCRFVGKNPLMAEYAREDGSCKNLTKEGLCAIYDHRPDVCNVDKAYERYFAGKMSREQWYKMNERSCEMIQNMFKGKNV